MKRFSVFILVLVIVLASGCGIGAPQDPEPIPHPPVEEEPKEDEIVEVSISSVGDIMAHLSQLQAAYSNENDTYDFADNYKFIKPYTERADISIANLETTFGGGDRSYSGYPMFNTPDSLADALAYAGFNFISTVNNHTIDTGISGMLRTLDILHSRNLTPVGTRRNTQEDSYVVEEVNGINVGLTAYSYESPSTDDIRRLNGIPIPKDAEALIDTFNYDNINADMEMMEQRISEMRDQGAEIIVFIVHWGNEYARSYNAHQENIANRLSDLGVDIIFGSHPHVIQPVEFIDSEVTGKRTVVAYSLGNFISNQRYEFLNNRLTEDGLIVSVGFEKNMTTGEITMDQVTYVPTWVNRHVVANRWVYEIIPVYQALENKEMFNLVSQDSIDRAKISLENTVTWIEEHNDEIILDKELR